MANIMKGRFREPVPPFVDDVCGGPAAVIFECKICFIPKPERFIFNGVVLIVVLGEIVLFDAVIKVVVVVAGLN